MKKNRFIKKMIAKKNIKLTITSIVLSILFFCTLIGTFSWFISSDYIANAFKGTRLTAEITEVFMQNTEWKPEEETKKEVRVENTGDVDAFVRVSMYEFLLLFKVDTTDKTGNGNLSTVQSTINPQVDAKDVSTWKTASDDGGTYTWYGKNYVANKSVIPDWKNHTGYYQYKDANRDSLLKEIQLAFGNVVTTVPATSTQDYWLYENGYFYYSRPLKPKEASDLLLRKATLNSTAPNKYKGSLYQIKIFMDAHDVTEPVFSSWNINTSEQAHILLGKYLN